MHEYAITKEILRICREFAKEKNFNKIKKFEINLGVLNSYEKEPILFYFNELKVSDELFSDAILVVNEIEGNDIKLVSVIADDGN